MWLRAAALGAVIALVAIAGLHWPLEREALNGLALFLAFTACVYRAPYWHRKQTAARRYLKSDLPARHLPARG